MDLTHEATWRGGPWDGMTIEVIRGEQYLPLYDLEMRLCPVVMDSDGRFIIHWSGSPASG